MATSITLKDARYINSVLQIVGATVSVDDQKAQEWVSLGLATWAGAHYVDTGPAAVTAKTDPVTGGISLNGASFNDCALFGADPTATAAVNTAAIQRALNVTGNIKITKPGIYQINATLTIPSRTSLEIGKNVYLVRIAGGNSCTLFANANPTTGDTNIALYGQGVLYFNANGYVNTYNANTTDCPYFADLFTANVTGIIEGGGTITGSNPYTNGVQFDNVSGLYVGGGLTLMQSAKYNLYGSMLTNFRFDQITVYGDDTVNPANGSTQGRDGIHVQGNSSNGYIGNITGTCNDDCVVLNTRDMAGMVTPRSTGPIRDVLIENIHCKNQRRAGSTVHIYGGLDVGTVDSGFTNGYDTAPTISGITNASGIATCTTATPHGMSPGAAFYITGSNITGYNTGTAAYGQTTPLGRVLTVPSTTTFTYFVPTATATPATAPLGTLVRYYQMDGITVRNVRGNTYTRPAVYFAVTADTANNFGVIDNVSVDNASNFVYGVPANDGVVRGDRVRLQDATFSKIYTQNNALTAALTFSELNCYLAGQCTVNGIWTETPYTPDSSGARNWINLGYHDNLTINGLSATLKNGGGGWAHALWMNGATPSNGTVVLNNPIIRSVSGSSYVGLMSVQTTGAAGGFVVNNANLDTNGYIGIIGANVTSANLSINGTFIPTLGQNLVDIRGTNITVSANGNIITTNSGGAGLLNLITPASATFYSSNNQWNAVPVISSGTTSAGLLKLYGNDINVDVGNAACTKTTSGQFCFNNGSARGTLTQNRLVTCNGTNWIQVDTPANLF